MYAHVSVHDYSDCSCVWSDNYRHYNWKFWFAIDSCAPSYDIADYFYAWFQNCNRDIWTFWDALYPHVSTHVFEGNFGPHSDNYIQTFLHVVSGYFLAWYGNHILYIKIFRLHLYFYEPADLTEFCYFAWFGHYNCCIWKCWLAMEIWNRRILSMKARTF